MAEIEKARKALVTRILEGEGKASLSDRRAAFDNREAAGPLSNLVGKVAEHAYQVTDGDMNSVRAASFSEDQIFEIVVCAAVGQATHQYDTAFAALQAATERSEHAASSPR
jgi:hypothetical protein